MEGHLGPNYRIFALLRICVLVGSFTWFALAPLPPGERMAVGFTLLAFLAYCLLLYLLVWKERISFRSLNIPVLVLDFSFATVLIVQTGGPGSDFYLAYYLLVALQAFFYGLTRGTIVAVISALLSLGVVLTSPGPAPWLTYGLRQAFLFLVAVSLGLLSHREKRERQEMQRLNRELREKGESLERAYRDLQEAQQHLVQSEKLASIGTLAAGLAHEINNPIGIITSRLECMFMEAAEKNLPESVQEDLRIIGKHAHRVAEIAQSLLSFSKQPVWRLAPLDLNAVVNDVLLLMEKQLANERIRLEKRLAPSLPLVQGSVNHLEQVFLNILNNAREAMGKGGTLKVETGRADGGKTIQVTISDTGKGITPEHLPKIFDPFYTTKPTGTGLGLSISYGIIQEHGGSLKATSRPGEGSSFVITLPVSSSSR